MYITYKHKIYFIQYNIQSTRVWDGGVHILYNNNNNNIVIYIMLCASLLKRFNTLDMCIAGMPYR